MSENRQNPNVWVGAGWGGVRVGTRADDDDDRHQGYGMRCSHDQARV